MLAASVLTTSGKSASDAKLASNPSSVAACWSSLPFSVCPCSQVLNSFTCSGLVDAVSTCASSGSGYSAIGPSNLSSAFASASCARASTDTARKTVPRATRQASRGSLDGIANIMHLPVTRLAIASRHVGDKAYASPSKQLRGEVASHWTIGHGNGDTSRRSTGKRLHVNASGTPRERCENTSLAELCPGSATAR